jgi:hypothetical protein
MADHYSSGMVRSVGSVVDRSGGTRRGRRFVSSVTVLAMCVGTVLLVPAGVVEAAVSVSGVVTDESGAALAGVTVAATGGDPVTTVSDESDTGGAYGLDLPEGTYSLTFSRTGYDPVTFTDVVVTESRVIDAVMAAVVVPPTLVPVTGRVEMGGGVPASGVAVFQQVTAADGSFTQMLPDGREFNPTITGPASWLCAFGQEHPDCDAPLAAGLPPDFQLRSTRVVTVSGPTDVGTFVVDPATVTVTLTSEGSPLTGAQIILSGSANFVSGADRWTGRTRDWDFGDEGGILYVFPGTYDLVVVAPGHENFTQRVDITGDTEFEIALTPDIPFVPVSATIVDDGGDPLEGVVMFTSVSGADGVVSHPIKADGREIELNLRGPASDLCNFGGDRPECSLPLDPVLPTYFSLKSNRVVTVSAPVELGSLVLDPVALDVAVTASGVPVPDATVLLNGSVDVVSGPDRWRGTVSGRGNGSSVALTTFAGTQQLFVQAPGFLNHVEELTISGDMSIEVELVPEPALVPVTGRVQLPDGSVPSGVAVFNRLLAPDGSFVLEVMADGRTLRPSVASMTFVCSFGTPNPDCGAPSDPALPGYFFVSSDRETEIDGPVDLGALVLAPSTVSVTVASSTGDPVLDPLVDLNGRADFTTGDDHWTGPAVDAKRVPNAELKVFPGSYRLFVGATGYTSVSQQVTITGDRTIFVALTKPNVAVAPSAGRAAGNFVVESPEGSTLSEVVAEPVEAVEVDGAEPLVGSISYEVSGLEPGANIDVVVELPSGASPDAVLKQTGDTVVDITDQVTIEGDVITVDITDGGVLDEDGVANGRIVDPLIPVRWSVPSAPEGVSAAASGPRSATVSFSPPASSGGVPVLDYEVTCTSGASERRVVVDASPAEVTGLLAGAEYTCGVAARNSVGAGESAAAAPFTTEVEVTETSTTLRQSSAATVFGAPVSLTADVTSLGGGPVDGDVVFRAGTTVLCDAVPLADGEATCEVSTLPLGSSSLVAEFLGGPTAPGSVSDPVEHVVGKAGSVTTLSSSKNPAARFEAVTFTARVSAVAPSAAVPDGLVTFLDGTTVLCRDVVLVAGSATCTTSSLFLGGHSVTARFAGSATVVGGTSAVLSQTIDRVPTATVLQTVPSSVHGQSVTLRAVVSFPSGQTRRPSGTVVFRDGATVIGRVSLVGGVASMSWRFATGSHDLTASFGGSLHDAPSASAIVPLVVSPGPTITTLTMSRTAPVGAAVRVTATVAYASPARGTLGGAVEFYDGEQLLATVQLRSGVATTVVRFATAGSRNVRAVYTGSPQALSSETTRSISVRP